jgi:DNA modification methylase
MDQNRGSVKVPGVKVKAQSIGKDYALYCGDSCEVLRGIPDNSIHYSIFSPPFESLYTYSNSDRDLGNCRSGGEFHEHFRFIVDQLFRVIMPGRLVSFHCMNLPTSKERDGFIGIRDFRGELIKMFQESGFIYHSEVCIWKDPVTAMQRTKALGLLHKQLKKDSCMSRQGIPDFLVTMRKPGENPERVTHTDDTFPVRVWQQYASPIWTDINPSDTLQYRSARENEDERHICPLQLTVIRRGIELWTNKNDIVLTPFLGIGSEAYMAVKMNRRAVGIELKDSYYRQAVENVKSATQERQMDLFDFLQDNGGDQNG